MPNIFFILQAIKIIFLILVSTIVHEYGHYIVAKFYSLNPGIEINYQSITVIYKGTDLRKNCMILSAGIISGLIVLIFLSIQINIGYIMTGYFIIGYIAACHHDMRQLIKRRNVKHKGQDVADKGAGCS